MHGKSLPMSAQNVVWQGILRVEAWTADLATRAVRCEIQCAPGGEAPDGGGVDVGVVFDASEHQEEALHHLSRCLGIDPHAVQPPGLTPAPPPLQPAA